MVKNDNDFMSEALIEAKKAALKGETPVGAVVVMDGEIIGRGHNNREYGGCATSHAEILAIEAANRAIGGWRLCGCDIYVTLEPCPMCAGAIINARLDRVIYGAADKKAGAASSVISLFEYPFNHRPKVTEGVMAEESAALLRDFFRQLREGK